MSLEVALRVRRRCGGVRGSLCARLAPRRAVLGRPPRAQHGALLPRPGPVPSRPAVVFCTGEASGGRVGPRRSKGRRPASGSGSPAQASNLTIGAPVAARRGRRGLVDRCSVKAVRTSSERLGQPSRAASLGTAQSTAAAATAAARQHGHHQAPAADTAEEEPDGQHAIFLGQHRERVFELDGPHEPRRESGRGRRRPGGHGRRRRTARGRGTRKGFIWGLGPGRIRRRRRKFCGGAPPSSFRHEREHDLHVHVRDLL